MLALAAPEPGVEQVPYSVAEHVHTIYDYSQADSRPKGQRWFYVYVFAPFTAEHSPPARNFKWQAKPKEAETSLS